MQTAKVLTFNITGEQYRLLCACAAKAGAQVLAVPQSDFSQSVGALSGALPPKKEVCFAPFEEQMLIMSAFEREQMDSFLEALRAAQVNIPYKAVVTPTNLFWQCDALLTELKKEHEQMQEAMRQNAAKKAAREKV